MQFKLLRQLQIKIRWVKDKLFSKGSDAIFPTQQVST